MTEFREAVERYLKIRRSLGFKMKAEERHLLRFAEFLEERGSIHITVRLAVEWATLPKACHPAHWKTRYCTVRRFARFVHALDPQTEVLPSGVLTSRYRRKAPHIYTEDEIIRLLKAAKQSRSPKGLWGWTFSTIFGLMTATGMRVCEIVLLDREDVDLGQGVIIVRETKFRKSRLVPVHPTVVKALRMYVRIRDRTCPQTQCRSFFVTEIGKQPAAKHMGKKFLVLARKIGLRGPNGVAGPRLHDLRHTFAVRTIINWYRSGANVDACLPQLSAYLGHLDAAQSYWYVSAIPELLDLAAQRLDQPKGDPLK
jgi:integrase